MKPRIDPRANGSTIHRLPQVFVNKTEEAILIRTLDDLCCQKLIDMYVAYEPKNSFQGLPPIQEKACVAWAQHMINSGINLVALSFGVGVVGHAALFPIDDHGCEMLIVISPSYQNTGIGTQLTRAIVQLAYEIGFDKVWLPVEARNARARHVYKKCGFEYLPNRDSRELEMAIDLQGYHQAVSRSIEFIMNRNVVFIRDNEPCRRALEIFLSRRIASLPVLDDEGRVVGMLSEMDLMLPSNLDAKVHEVLTRDVVSVHNDSTIAKVIRLFLSKRIRCIPVVDEEMRLTGIVGRKDILAYYANGFLKPHKADP
ncbi:MAG: GNAT family N-acetyltransferase [Thermoguttaceae bacterium]